jgi:hypothetical protein
MSKSRIARLEQKLGIAGKAAANLDAPYCALFAYAHPANPEYLAAFLDQYALSTDEAIPLAVPARLREFVVISMTAQDEGAAMPPSDYLPIASLTSLNVTVDVAAAMYQYRVQSWHVQHASEYRYTDRGGQLDYFAGRVRDALTYWIHNHTHPSLKDRPMVPEELNAYLDDPTTRAAGVCNGCGGPLPLSPARHINGIWRRRVVHLSACPRCGCTEFHVDNTAFRDWDDPAVARAKFEARNGRPAQQPRPSEVPPAPQEPQQPRMPSTTPVRANVADEADDLGLAAYAPARRPWPPDKPRY